jgi:hypothetical protein
LKHAFPPPKKNNITIPKERTVQIYTNAFSILSCVSVKSIRTCYPQTPNGPGPATNRSAKLDMLFANKVIMISMLLLLHCGEFSIINLHVLIE